MHSEVSGTAFTLLLGLFPQGKRQTWYNSTLASRRKRLTAHFEDLEQCYFSSKMSRITGAVVEGLDCCGQIIFMAFSFAHSWKTGIIS